LTKLLPKTLIKVSSPINGEISVVEQFGKRRIVIGGLTQSGPMAEEIWKVGLREILNLDKLPQLRQFVNNLNLKILILGLGGGSLVKLLNQHFPSAKIIGVEIDPIMIDLGKRYLELKKAKNLKIIIGDAADFVRGSWRGLDPSILRFDLIFVDLYFGDRVPEFLNKEKFLLNFKKILNENGLVVFNRLYNKNHIFEAKIFLDKLKKIFNDLSSKKFLTNLLIFCRN